MIRLMYFSTQSELLNILKITGNGPTVRDNEDALY